MRGGLPCRETGVGDVLVLERDELNAATTSQAAGLIGQLRNLRAEVRHRRPLTLADIAALEAEGLVSASSQPARCGWR